MTGEQAASLAPWLSVSDATSAVAFSAAAFGAEQLYALDDDGVVQVAQLKVSGAPFWIQREPDGTPEALGGRSPVRLHLRVADPDAGCDRAVAAGATEVSPVVEEHGWRVGRVADPSGHHWEIARQLAD